MRTLIVLLEIVIRLKFCRIRNLFHLFQLFTLARYPYIDKALREDAAFCQIIMVGFQCIQRFAKGLGKSFDLLLFFFGQRIKVEVIRPPAIFSGIDLFLDTIQSRHQDCRISIIWISRCVGIAQFKPFRFRRLRIGRNTDDRAAVGSRITDRDRRFISRYETFERVRGRVGECAQRCDVLQKAADKIMCRAAETGIAVFVVEQRFSILH